MMQHSNSSSRRRWFSGEIIVTPQTYYRDLDRRVDESGEKCVTCPHWTCSHLYIRGAHM